MPTVLGQHVRVRKLHFAVHLIRQWPVSPHAASGRPVKRVRASSCGSPPVGPPRHDTPGCPNPVSFGVCIHSAILTSGSTCCLDFRVSSAATSRDFSGASSPTASRIACERRRRPPPVRRRLHIPCLPAASVSWPQAPQPALSVFPGSSHCRRQSD